jgi:RNA polymerase sigma factor (sigma-70 family)
LNTLNDNALMLLVKAGDLDRMSLLFERHSRALFGFLFHMTGRREMSEDLVQNVFYRMLKYRHNFTADSHFTGWMYHIARNELKDVAKKRGATENYEQLNDHEERISDGELVDQRLEKKEAHMALDKAILRLNAGDREILILSRFQELKYAEIGDLIGITPGAVKVRVHRAMQELKRIYLQTERKQKHDEM